MQTSSPPPAASTTTHVGVDPSTGDLTELPNPWPPMPPVGSAVDSYLTKRGWVGPATAPAHAVPVYAGYVHPSQGRKLAESDPAAAHAEEEHAPVHKQELVRYYTPAHTTMVQSGYVHPSQNHD